MIAETLNLGVNLKNRAQKLQDRKNDQFMPSCAFALEIHIDNLLNEYTEHEILIALGFKVIQNETVFEKLKNLFNRAA